VTRKIGVIEADNDEDAVAELYLRMERLGL
jgi:hypothetical protein